MKIEQKGVMRKVKGWIMEKIGNLKIRKKYLKKMIKWIYSLWREREKNELERKEIEKEEIMRIEEKEMMQMIESEGLRKRMSEEGNMEI